MGVFPNGAVDISVSSLRLAVAIGDTFKLCTCVDVRQQGHVARLTSTKCEKAGSSYSILPVLAILAWLVVVVVARIAAKSCAIEACDGRIDACKDQHFAAVGLLAS